MKNEPDFGSLPLRAGSERHPAPRAFSPRRQGRSSGGRACPSFRPSPRWRPLRRRGPAPGRPAPRPVGRPRLPAPGPRSALPPPLPARAPPRSQAARSAAPISRHCAKWRLGAPHAAPASSRQLLGCCCHSRCSLRRREAHPAWEGAGEERPSPRGGAAARDAGPRRLRPVGEMPCGEDWLSHPLGIVQGFFGEWRPRGRAGRAAELTEPRARPRCAAPRGATSRARAAETVSRACAGPP